MSEMAQIADHVIVVGRGRLIADTTTTALLAGASTGTVVVRSPYPGLAEVLEAKGGTVASVEDALQITGLTAEQVGEAALAAGAVLHELRVVQTSLEEAYVDMTKDAIEFTAGGVA